MNNSVFSNRKVIWALLIVLVLAVAAVLFYSGVFKSNNSTETPLTTKTEPTVETKEVEKSQLPDKFPADFPIEAGATVTTNNVKTSSDGRFQSTHSFESAKTVDQNFAIYSDYFKTHGWIINSTVTTIKNYRSIYAGKGDITIQVSINDNQATHVKTVDIYVVQMMKQASINQ